MQQFEVMELSRLQNGKRTISIVSKYPIVVNTFAYEHNDVSTIFDVRNIIPAAAEPVYGWMSATLAVGYLNVNLNVKNYYLPTYFVQSDFLMRNIDYDGSVVTDGHLDAYQGDLGSGFSKSMYHGPGFKINYPSIHTKISAMTSGDGDGKACSLYYPYSRFGMRFLIVPRINNIAILSVSSSICSFRSPAGNPIDGWGDLVTNSTSNHVYTVYRNETLQGGTIMECNNPVMVVINTDYPTGTYCIGSKSGCGANTMRNLEKNSTFRHIFQISDFGSLWLNPQSYHKRRATIQVFSYGGNYTSDCNEPGKVHVCYRWKGYMELSRYGYQCPRLRSELFAR